MLHSTRTTAAVLISLSGTSLAIAQTVSNPIATFNGSSSVAYVEPAIVASPLDANQAVVMCNKYHISQGNASARVAEYIPTLCTFCTDQMPIAFPEPDYYTHWNNTLQDPGVAASPFTGDLFISGSTTLAVDVGRIPYGSTTLDTTIEALQFDTGLPWLNYKDKPFISAGRWVDSNQITHNALYLAYVEIPIGHAYANLRSSHSLDAAATSWATTVAADGGPKIVDAGASGATVQGAAPFPVALPGGRVVLGWVGFDAGNTAYATWTDRAGDYFSGGQRWQPYQHLNQFGSPAVTIYGPPDSLPNSVLVTADLSACGDPNNGTTDDNSIVLIAFTGRVDDTSDNTDIFIARSATGGAPNPNVPGSKAFPVADTVRITDTILHNAGVGSGDTAEYHPSVAIDGTGGINLLLCQTDLDDPDQLNYVWYVRWPSYASLEAGNTPYAAAMGHGFAAWQYFGTGSVGNDFQMICNDGCDRLLAAYASAESGYWSVYVRSISLGTCAYADVTGNGVVGTDDAVSFFGAYVAGSPIADRNQDRQVDTRDITLFLDSYNH